MLVLVAGHQFNYQDQDLVDLEAACAAQEFYFRTERAHAIVARHLDRDINHGCRADDCSEAYRV